MSLFLRPRTITRRQQVAAIGVFALLISSVVLAQQKRPLTAADYDAWRSIQGQTLSRDGKYLAYALVPQDGDGEVVVRHLESGKEWRAGRGAAPVNPPQPVPGAEPPTGPPPFAGRPAFTADSRFVVFQILPSKADTDKAKREKRKPEDMPKNALGVIDLVTGETMRVDGVKSFQVPENGPALIAYLKEPKKEEKKPDAAAAASDKKKEKKKEYGGELVLKNLGDRSERTFADVTEYTLSKDGRSLVFAVSSKNEDANGAFVAVPGSADAPAALLTGKGKYTKLVWDDKQTQLAFLSDRDDAAASQPRFKLYHWPRNAATAAEVVSTASAGFPPNRIISDKGAIAFSLDGAKLFFGTTPPPLPEKDEEENPDDKVLVDLWHWKDDYIQPMQRIRAEQERNRSYRAVYHLKEKRFVQLADETMRDLVPASDGRWALGMDDRAYRAIVGYDDDSNSSDVYLVNTTDGSRKLIGKRHRFPVSWSPAGHYALFYDGKDWNTISVPDGKVTNLTASLGVKFYAEDHDSPSTPPSYGNAGWTADEKYVLLYDRFDIWQVAPDGSNAKNLTAGVGRKEQTQFRYVKLDPQEKAIDATKPLLLRAENEWTRDSGFYRGRINGGAPEKLVMAAKHFTPPVKAKEAEVYALTASRFDEFPDLLIADASFGNFKKVSDANPQKANLLWGTSELIRFKNTDGVPLSAMLIKPANFDPSKKYPMIVYIYEQLSENLHRFVDPRPGHNINASLYASNGYLVLMPDIVYTIGYPGQSALKCVLPAVQAVVDRGFVNEEAIGIQGHSWGGYQIAYMITQTTRFKAAEAGAPVANMTSAYSGIRWGTGLPRQFQYEHTQSRIGASLYEAPMLFMENSPVFRADRVRTPLMMIANDNDDAVPWYQGIEYYLALRRLGKEVYLFSYNGEFHGLRRRADQKDYAMRLQQFFDHFLKGAPAPEWMEKGIPYIEREREKEKYKATADTKEKAQN
ncbi:MAG TPA: prolyl oligopeptidase family serine peptidase [Blastocatellia bacterium]|nr:prolyl oligopeptidase family serine peptidase [Blastocatellia bacterium]